MATYSGSYLLRLLRRRLTQLLVSFALLIASTLIGANADSRTIRVGLTILQSVQAVQTPSTDSDSASLKGPEAELDSLYATEICFKQGRLFAYELLMGKAPFQRAIYSQEADEKSCIQPFSQITKTALSLALTNSKRQITLTISPL